MEPTKFEQRIKEKLDGREIQPSEQLWETLHAKLEVKPAAPTSRRTLVLYWMSAAAIVLVLLSIGLKFGQGNDKVAPTNEIVNTPQKTIEPQENPTRTIKITPEAPIQIADQKRKIKDAPVRSTEIVPVDKSIEVRNVKRDEVLAIHPAQDSLTTPTDQLLQNKINQVLAQVQALENNSTNLTDAEVDSLLRIAQKEILDQKYNRFDQSVDAMALLDEVEFEIDGTIKEKLFEVLKKGFKEVRTAVAQRNQ